MTLSRVVPLWTRSPHHEKHTQREIELLLEPEFSLVVYGGGVEPQVCLTETHPHDDDDFQQSPSLPQCVCVSVLLQFVLFGFGLNNEKDTIVAHSVARGMFQQALIITATLRRRLRRGWGNVPRNVIGGIHGMTLLTTGFRFTRPIHATSLTIHQNGGGRFRRALTNGRRAIDDHGAGTEEEEDEDHKGPAY